MIIFPHIPKCGGSSVRTALGNAYGDRLSLLYSNPWNQGPVTRFKVAVQQRWPDNRTTDVIYGHFSLERFFLFSKICDPKFAMFFRHPIDLSCSMYFYEKQKKPQKYAEITYLDLLRSKKMRSFFRTYLAWLPVESLDYVGIQEYIDDSICLFDRKFGTRLEVPNENVTKGKPTDYWSHLKESGELELALELMSENIEIYEAAKSRFRQLCSDFEIETRA